MLRRPRGARWLPLSCAAFALLAHAQSCDTAGTWTGTLGGRPLMLDLNWDGLGSYYLGTDLDGALLRPQADAALAWDELDATGRRTGTLRLACTAAGLQGERVAGDGRRSALQLQRTEGGDYNRRRIAALDLAVQRSVVEQGRAVEIVAPRRFAALQTVRIRQPHDGEAAVNERLRERLLKQVDNQLSCQALARARGDFGAPSGDELSVQHVLWRGNIFFVELWLQGHCAGLGEYRGAEPFTFDTRTGQELPLADWLAPDLHEGIAAGTPLHAAQVLPRILRGRKQPAELPPASRDCAEYELDERAVPLALDERGLVFGFHYSAAMQACGLSFLLPWTALEAHLSPEGVRWRQAMEAAPRR